MRGKGICIVSILALAEIGLVGAEPPTPVFPATHPHIVIKVKPEGFGDANQRDIEKVLVSVSEQFSPYFPGRKIPAILVERSKGSPITKFKRGPKGEIVIGLNVEGRYWAQFAYQFAHEFTHVLSNYERVADKPYANQWFIESLCETASMFAVSKMAECWATNAPYPHWRSFAVHLLSYSSNLVNAPDRQLPVGTTLAHWYALHASELRQNPVNRKFNAIVALQLLPFFEQKPANWELVGYLNLREGGSSESFEDFFAHWAEAAPERLRPFVWQIASRFDIQRRSRPDSPNKKAAGGGPI